MRQILTLARFRAYADHLKKKGLNESLIKDKLSSISIFVKWASEKGLIEKKELWQIEKEIANITAKKINKDRSRDSNIKNSLISRQTPFSYLIGGAFVLIFMAVLGAGVYNQFFRDAKTPFAYPTSLTRGTRTLSFQGRLTDNLRNPITTATNMVFRLYNHSSSTAPQYLLYSTGTCSVTPDQDGIFNSLIGQDCGAEIGSSVFTENQNVYLDVQIGSESLSPRQQIANVGYAMNAETLQGFPASIGAVGSTVPFIPYVDSSGLFAINSDRASISLGSGTGPHQITTGGTSALALMSGGNVGIGTTAPSEKIDIAGTGSNLTFSGTSTVHQITTGGTSDLSLNPGGNVGVGMTNPAYKLDVLGSVHVSSNGLFESKVGIGYTNPASRLTVAGGAAIGSTNPSSLFLSTIAPSGGLIVEGNVGIGNTGSSFKLDVSGNTNIGGTISVGGFRLGTSTSAGYVLTADSNGYGTWQASATTVSGNGATNYLARWINSTQISTGVSYDNGSFLGVGTTVSGSRLVVSGGIGIGTTDQSSTYLSTSAPSGGAIIEGNVGIGTTNPNAKLQVVGITNLQGTTISQLSVTGISSLAGTTSSQFYSSGAITGATTLNIVGNSNLAGTTVSQFYNSGTSAFAGNVGIGTSSPVATYKLYVAGAIYGTTITQNGNLVCDSSGLNCPVNNLTGGATNYLARWISATQISTGVSYDNGTAVGIGTTNPVGLLSVGVGQTSGFFVLANGNVGIGITNPAFKLQVIGTISGTGVTTSTLTATGLTTLAGTTASQFHSTGAISGGSTLNITGVSNLAGTTISQLSVTGVSSLAGTTATQFYSSGAISGGSSLTIVGNSNLAGTTVSQLYVTGATNLNTLVASGLSTLAGVTASQFHSTGAISGGSTLNITGLSTLAGATASQFYSTGAIAGGSSLTIVGNTNLAGTTVSQFYNSGTSAFAGNVGIGTSSPVATYKLYVAGAIYGTTISQNGNLVCDSSGLNCPTNNLTGGATNYLARWISATQISTGVSYDNGTAVGIGTTNPMALLSVGVGQTSGFFVGANGNVGVGITNPSFKLQVIGTISGTGVTTSTLTATGLTTLAGTTASQFHSTGAISGGSTLTITGLSTLAGATASQFHSTGAISGATTLNIVGLSTLAGATASQFHSTGAISGGSSLTIVGNTNLAGTTVSQFYNSGTSAFAGNVGIGTSSPVATYKLYVAGAIYGTTITQNGNTVCDNSNNCAYTSGNGATNYLARWISSTQLSTGVSYDDGSSFGIGTTAPIGLMTVGVGQTSALFILNNGNIGIGITSTTARVQVVNATTPSAYIRATPSGGVELNSSQSNNEDLFRIDSTGGLTASTLTTHRFGRNGNGDLGLDLMAASYRTVDLNFIGTSTKWRVRKTTDSSGSLLTFQRSTNGTTFYDVFTLDNASGNVGISTTAPMAVLDVAGGIVGYTGATLYGARFNPSITGTISNTQPIVGLYGIYNVPSVTVTGTAPHVNNLYVGYNGFSIGTGTTITNYFGHYIAAPSGSTASQVVNRYALVTEPNAGNVGIGTTAPFSGVRLDVAGQVRVGTTGATTANNLCIDANGILSACNSSSSLTGTGQTNYLARWLSATQLSTGISYDNGTFLGVGYTAAVSGSFLVNGNVGIGTTNPIAKLQVIGTTNLQGTTISQLSVTGISNLAGTTVSQFHDTGDLTVLGITNLAGTTASQFYSSGAISGGSSLTIVGNSNLAGTTASQFYSSGRLTAAGVSNLAGTTISQLSVTGISSLAGTTASQFHSTGAISGATTLNIVGLSTLAGTTSSQFHSTGAISGGSTLTITGLSTLAGATASQFYSTGAIAGGSTLNIVGLSTLAGTTSSQFHSTGAISGGSTLTITGLSTLAGATASQFYSTGAIAGGSTLTIVGNTNLAGTTVSQFYNSGTSAFAGNVGIGTSSPVATYKLYVAGAIYGTTLVQNGNTVCDSSGNCPSSLSGTGSTNYLARWISATQLSTGVSYDNGTAVGIGTTNPMALLSVGVGQTSGFFVGANGNVGVGITNPSFKLQVIGTISGTGVTTSTLTATGLTTLAGTTASQFHSTGAISGGSTLTITGLSTLAGATSSQFHSTGAISGATTLNIVGLSTLAGSTASQFYSTGAIAGGSTLTIVGNTNLAGTTISQLSVTGISSLAGTTASQFHSTGAISGATTLNIVGLSTLAGATASQFHSTGAISGGSSLTIVGNTNLAGTTVSQFYNSGTSAFAGNVGIGTSSPVATYKLYVAGAIYGTTITQNGNLVCDSSGLNCPVNNLTGGATNYLARWISATQLSTGISYDNGSFLGVGYTAAVSGSFLVNGNVGIGTTNPRAPFEVASAITGYTGATLYGARFNPSITGTISNTQPIVGLYGIYNVPSVTLAGTAPHVDNLYVGYNGFSIGTGTTITNYFGHYIAAPSGSTASQVVNRYALVTEPNAGNVGIGTTAPAAKLQVIGTTNLQGTTISQLSVTGISNLAGTTVSQFHDTGDLTVLGVTNLAGTTASQFYSSGRLTAAGVSNLAGTTISQLSVTGISSLAGTTATQFHSTGAISGATTLNIVGLSTLAGTTSSQFHSTGAISGGSSLTIVGNSNLAGTTISQLSVTGVSSLAGTTASQFHSTGAISGATTLNITGLSTLGGATASQFYSTGAIAGGSSLTIVGNTNLAGTTVSQFYNSGTSAFAGNVGIGTSSPVATYKLYVAGAIYGTTLTQNGFNVCDSSGWNCPSSALSGGATNYLARWISATQLSTGISYDNGTFLGIGYTAAVSGSFLVNGNVGIGTTNPIARLSVGIGTTTGFYVHSNGNVGIGSTSSTERLSIGGGNIIHTAYGDIPTKGTYNTPGNGRGVYVSGRYAYLADQGTGVQIIDIQNPAAPAFVGTYDTPGTAQDVYVAGKYMYVADDTSGLEIFDVSKPTAPQLVGSYDTAGNSLGVYVSGKYAYVADFTSGLAIIDISDPTAPTLAGSLDTTGSGEDVYVQGRYAYIADGGTGLQIIDVSNPTSPTVTGTIDSTTSTARGIFVSGKYAYLGAGSDGLQIINISNPASPSLVATSATGGTARGVFVSGKYAYVASTTVGMKMVDVSTPASPVIVGTFSTSAQNYSVFVAGKYVYVGADTGGLEIGDINGIETATLYAGDIQTGGLTVLNNVDIGNNLYVRSGLNVGPGGLYVDEGEVAIDSTSSDVALLVNQKGTGYTFRANDQSGDTTPFIIDASGNVGIGTTTPTTGVMLDVVGQIRVGSTAAATSAQLCVNSSGILSACSVGTVSGGATNYLARWISATQLSTGISYDNGTFLGVGTTIGASKLTVGGNASIGIAYTGIAAPTNGLLVQGNLGVGSTAARASIEAAGQILGQDGSASAPTFASRVAPNTGINFRATSSLDAYVNGTAYFALNGNGFQLKSGTAFAFSSGDPVLVAPDVGFSRGVAGIMYAGNGTPGDSSGGFVAGNIGIGTTIMTSKLTIAGNQSIGVAYTGVAAPTDGLIVQGNVGIGTTNPSYTLDVAGIGNFSVGITAPNVIYDVNVNSPLASTGGQTPTLSCPTCTFGTGTTNFLGRWISSTQLSTGISYDDSTFLGIGYTVAINSPKLIVNGNVGVGTSSPNHGLEVFGQNFGLSAGGVSHGMTNLTATNTYLELESMSGTAGGGRIGGFSDTDAGGLFVRGLIGSNNPADSTPAIELVGGKYDGGVAQTSLANEETVLKVSNHTTGLLYILGNGNVGLGFTSPASKLMVSGGATIGVGYSATVAPTDGLLVQGNVGIGVSLPTGKLEVQNGTTQILWAGTNGNVGIGTSNPTNSAGSGNFKTLDLQGAWGSNLRLGTRASTQWDIWTNYTYLYVNQDGTNRLTINPSGSVGIGTTFPVSRLTVAGNQSIGVAYSAVQAPTNGLIVQGNVGIGSTGSSNKLTIGGNQSIGVAYTGLAAPTNGLIVQGNVGIGHTNPGYMFSAWGSSSVVTAPLYAFTNRGTGNSIAVVKVSVGSALNSNARLISFYAGAAVDTGGSGVGNIRLGVTGVQYMTVSADFGEYFTKGQSDLVAGDVVAFDSQGRVIRAVAGQTPVGVVSDNAGFVGNAGGDEDDPNKIVVGLLGQVGTKVDPASDPIQPGDALVPSTRAGYVKKATSLGPTVGNAVESWNPNVPKERIIAYVRGSWYDPDLYLTSAGDIHISADTGPFVYNGNMQNDTDGINNALYSLRDASGRVISRIGAFSEVIAAKIKTGYLSAENVLIKNTLVAKNITSEQLSSITAKFDTLLVNQKITSPVVETNNLIVSDTAKIDKVETNEIKPQSQDLTVNLSQTSPTNNPGELAKLIIKGLEEKTVASIDSAGNATFSGTLAAKDASISGRLVAGRVDAENISALESNIASQSADLNNLSSNINEVQALLADLQNQPLADPQYYQSLPDNMPPLSTGSATLASLTTDSLTVSGQSNLYNLSVSNSAMVGTLLMQDNTLLSLSSELKLNALNSINIFDGQVTIAKNGTITTNGSVIAKGGVQTNEIKSIDGQGVNLILNANAGSKEKLKIKNNLGTEVAAIDASGSAYFKDGIAFDKYLEATSSASIASAADTFAASGIYSPSIKTESQTAGVGLMPTGSPEILIYNEKVTDDSLIYVTATSPTFGKSLYLAQKQSCQPQTINCKPYFKVAIDGPTTSDIHFNWWIVN